MTRSAGPSARVPTRANAARDRRAPGRLPPRFPQRRGAVCPYRGRGRSTRSEDTITCSLSAIIHLNLYVVSQTGQITLTLFQSYTCDLIHELRTSTSCRRIVGVAKLPQDNDCTRPDPELGTASPNNKTGIYDDCCGPSLTSAAPVLAPDGRVVAVLAVDLDAPPRQLSPTAFPPGRKPSAHARSNRACNSCTRGRPQPPLPPHQHV